jgi:hypothetical protein
MVNAEMKKGLPQTKNRQAAPVVKVGYLVAGAKTDWAWKLIPVWLAPLTVTSRSAGL